MQYFHVAGIRRRAIKDLGSQARLAHLLGQVGVFHGVKTGALLPGQKEVPQARFPGLGFQRFQNLRLTVSQDKRIVNLDLGDELVLDRHDLLVNEASDPLK